MNRYQISSALGKWVVYAHNEEQASLISKLLIQQDNIDYTIHRLDKEEQQMTNWYDYDNQEMVSLPPVGEIVITDHSDENLKVKILEHTFNGVSNIAVCRVISDFDPNLGRLGYYQNFFPSDWNKNEGKNKLINIIFDYTQHRRGEGLTYYDIATELYALGYLKLPEDR
mgnify:CR=1 FL=1